MYTNLRENMFEWIGYITQKWDACSAQEAFVKKQVFCVFLSESSFPFKLDK